MAPADELSLMEQQHSEDGEGARPRFSGQPYVRDRLVKQPRHRPLNRATAHYCLPEGPPGRRHPLVAPCTVACTAPGFRETEPSIDPKIASFFQQIPQVLLCRGCSKDFQPDRRFSE